MVYPKLICLLVLLPIIFSYPTPPIPTNPAIRFQITKTGFEKLKGFLGNFDAEFDLELNFGGITSNGPVRTTGNPEIKIEIIENTKDAFRHEGFIRLDTLGNTLHRKKRYAPTYTKVYYEDSEFVAGQEIGGLKIVEKGLKYEINMNMGSNQFLFQLSNCVETVKIYLGQQDGRLKIARFAVEIDGDLKTSMNGENFELDQETRNHFLQKFVEASTRTSFMSAKSHLGDIKYVLGSEVFDKVVFDYRLTEHPQFKDGVAEFALVGKFIYDEEEEYTDKNILEKLDEMLLELESYLHSYNLNTGSETYTKVHNVYNTRETPKIKALAVEGSDEKEATKKAQATLKINLSEDFFNSFMGTLIESGMTKFVIDRTKLVTIINKYNSLNFGEPIDVFELPDGISIFFDIQPYGIGQKFYTLYEGGYIEKVAFVMHINDLAVKLKVHSEIKILYRNGKIALDVLKYRIHEEADKEFPDILTRESFKETLDDYLKALNLLVSKYSEFLTEFSLKNGHLIFGLNTDSFQ